MKRFDVVVVGGGPAGMAAATMSAELGLSTALVEEGASAGGQVYREASVRPAAHDGETTGDVLRRQLRASEVSVFVDHSVWNVGPGFDVDVAGPDGVSRLHGEALIVATGTHERVVPVKGWTLPGVIGLGAASILMKAQRVLPGTNVVVAGVGPLVPLVASLVLESGGTLAAVVDLSSTMDFASRLPAMLSRLDLVRQGLRWRTQLKRSHALVLPRHTVVEIEGRDGVKSVRVSPVDRDWTPGASSRTIACDAVCLGHGLCPATELPRLLGASQRFEPELGGWLPATDVSGRTDVPRLYVAGDAAGVHGVAAAPVSGMLAAVSAAAELGRLDASRAEGTRAPLASTLRRASRFGRAMSSLTCPRPGLIAAIDRETIVCRCEDVPRDRIDSAIAEGCRDVFQVKAATRCGMGPCQGRMCGDSVAAIVAAATGLPRESVGQLTARAPLTPLDVGQLTGSYDYADVEPAFQGERAPS